MPTVITVDGVCVDGAALEVSVASLEMVVSSDVTDVEGVAVTYFHIIASITLKFPIFFIPLVVTVDSLAIVDVAGV